jgi:hypothetical protein
MNEFQESSRTMLFSAENEPSKNIPFAEKAAGIAKFGWTAHSAVNAGATENE